MAESSMSNGNRESLLHRPMTNQMTPLSLLHRSPETGNGEWGLTALVVVSQRLHRCTCERTPYLERIFLHRIRMGIDKRCVGNNGGN